MPLGRDGAPNGVGSAPAGLAEQTPETAGLGNNAVLAFRFRGQAGEGWPVRVASLEDPPGEGEDE